MGGLEAYVRRQGIEVGRDRDAERRSVDVEVRMLDSGNDGKQSTFTELEVAPGRDDDAR
jgi:hypothetical protein